MIARIHIDKLQILNDHLQSPFIQNLIFFSGNEALKNLSERRSTKFSVSVYCEENIVYTPYFKRNSNN